MNTEIVSNVTSLVSAIASVIATVFAAVELSRSRKANEEIKDRERKEATINAYNNLQNQVLDKLVSFSAEEIEDLVENIDRDEFKKIYMDMDKRLDEQVKMVQANQTELKGQLTDLLDSEKYLKLIEERNKEIEKEKAKKEGLPVEESKPSIYANRQTEIKINTEVLRQLGLASGDEEE